MKLDSGLIMFIRSNEMKPEFSPAAAISDPLVTDEKK